MIRSVVRVLFTLIGFGAVLYGLVAGTEWQESRWLALLVASGVLFAIAWWPSGVRQMPLFNRTLLRWVTVVIVAFVLITIQLVRIQIVQSDEIGNRIEVTDGGEVVVDPRLVSIETDTRRGKMLDRNGVVLVESVEQNDGSFERLYHEPSTAGLTGYYSPVLYGSSGLEAAWSAELLGKEGGNPAVEWLDELLHRERTGYDLHLTIDVELQRRARDLLNGRPGAVILMDPDTGEILAMASAPAYDPNPLSVESSSDSSEEVEQAVAYWSQLVVDPSAPLVFRPTQGQYVPGSTFKMVTGAGALAEGIATPEQSYRDEGSLVVDGRVIIELNRPDPNRVHWTFEEAFAYSLNVVFAQVGLDMGAERLLEAAEQFGFGSSIPFDLPVEQSRLIDDASRLVGNRTLVADSAFGQGEILVTPLQMALVGAAIVNDGEVMRPRLVSGIYDDGRLIQRYEEERWLRAMDSETARSMQRLMIASVDYGYASGAAIEGVTVGGKTGTAETGTGEPHAWFVGYSDQGEDQRLVTAVIVENGGRGGDVALPIGRSMLKAGMERSTDGD